jgi:DNA-binding NtrC family response regulator
MTQPDKYKILLVDDDSQVLKMLHILFQLEYETFLASSGPESIEIVRQNRDIAAVVMDIRMSDMDGKVAAREIKKLEPQVSIIFHTAYPGDYDEDEIDEQEKPFDYIEKGESISKLTRAIRNAVESHTFRNNAALLPAQAESRYGMFGKSPAMLEVYGEIRKAAATDAKVIILGETGTGKDLVARAIHYNGKRRNERYCIFPCYRKSLEIVESELFGYAKGAFTGAIEDKIGMFEYANGGTVLLDEIGDLDFNTQTKLLRVMQTGEYYRIGDPKIRTTDVRVLSATHRDLEQMIKSGDFRDDFYYRINENTISLPPLRERREDIPLLLNKFIDRFTIEKGRSPKMFDKPAIDTMVAFDWPGNVRQLENAVKSLIERTESDIIFEDDVRNYLKLRAAGGDRPTPATRNLTARLKEFRRHCIIEALKETGGNVPAAAALLEIDRSNLRKMIKQLKTNSEGNINSD